MDSSRRPCRRRTAFARFLVENGLVDEVWFWVNPTIQGPADRPFQDGPPINLELLGSRSFDSGVPLLRYRPVVSPESPTDTSE